MRAVIQRVSEVLVTIDNETVSRIGLGLLVLLGIEENDTIEDIEWLSGKISRLRIFDDENGIMNVSVVEKGGELMVVSQFTLHASTKKGNRPSYIKAAKPEKAVPLYEQFINQIQTDTGITVQTGKFGAMMKIHLVNTGPVTIIIDTKHRE